MRRGIEACATLIACLAAGAIPADAQQGGEEGPQESTPQVLSLACEVALALAAAPAHLRESAGVWTFEADGYRRHRDSANGFDCIVNRDHPRALKPVCFDAEGARTIVPKILFFGARLANGEAPADIARAVEREFAAGRFESPARAGVAYMLSDYNRPAGPSGVASFPPHVMYYAPDLTNEDIGFSREAAVGVPGLPFVAYQGPHGFLIAVDSAAAAAPRQPLEACEGEIAPPS